MAHAPHICTLVIRAILLQLLWCHLGQAAAEVVLAREHLVLASEAKIGELEIGHLSTLVNVH